MSRYFADTSRSLKQAAAYAAEQVEMLGAESASALREAVTLLMAVESGNAPGNGLDEVALTVALRTRALRDALAEPVRLVVCALQSSELEIGGDLEITGRGAIGCTLRVLGNVSLQAEGSTLRGGSLYLGGTGRIRELGSTGEKLTEVRLGPHARVLADIVHPGVVIETADGEVVRFTQRGVEPRHRLARSRRLRSGAVQAYSAKRAMRSLRRTSRIGSPATRISMPAARGKITLSPGAMDCTSSPTATTMPARTEISDDPGMISPERVSWSSSVGSTTRWSSSGSMRAVCRSERESRSSVSSSPSMSPG